MQIMDLARADAVRDNLTIIDRKLNQLSEDVTETIPQLRQYTGLEEAVQNLVRLQNSILDETEVVRQMGKILTQSIAYYHNCEMSLADNVEEARAITGSQTEAAEWNTPDWAFTLLH